MAGYQKKSGLSGVTNQMQDLSLKKSSMEYELTHQPPNLKHTHTHISNVPVSGGSLSSAPSYSLPAQRALATESLSVSANQPSGVALPTSSELQMRGAIPFEATLPYSASLPTEGDFPVRAQVTIDGQLRLVGSIPLQMSLPVHFMVPLAGELPLEGLIPLEGVLPITGSIPVEGLVPVHGSVPIDGNIPLGANVLVEGAAALGGALETATLSSASNVLPSKAPMQRASSTTIVETITVRETNIA